MALSVLALSSRFDGRMKSHTMRGWWHLSVLALSSRFDGPAGAAHKSIRYHLFQYSLCRVVLMVFSVYLLKSRYVELSVLALSSRFDGHY